MNSEKTTLDFKYNADGIRTKKIVSTTSDHVHAFQDAVVQPTCTENGYTLHSCICGYIYQDAPTAATGHTFTTTVVGTNCTEVGHTVYSCACGYSYEDGSNGHTFTTLVVEPTETVNGFTLHECECGYSYESDPVVSLAGTGGNSDTVEDVKVYDYVYNGSSLTQLTITTTVCTSGTAVETLYFAYDGSSPMTVTYGDEVFYYVTNLQGDVIAILDDEGAAVVEYSYDAWGNILTTSGTMANTLGVANPLTYRGYVYDQESGLYYLQSRYYNANVGRFINSDTLVSTGQGMLGNNMFAYCGNTPTMFSDPSGHIRTTVFPIQISDGTVTTQKQEIPDNIYTKSTGFINGQGVCPYASERMGFGTYGKNGCGIIAIYNAMQLLGYQEVLAVIETDVFLEGGYFCGGLLGIKPWAIDGYFEEKNIQCIGYRSYNTMLQSITEGDVIIFMVMNNIDNIMDGFHYMAAQYVGGEFIVYNISNSRTTPKTVQTLDPVYGNSRWCYGFVVGG